MVNIKNYPRWKTDLFTCVWFTTKLSLSSYFALHSRPHLDWFTLVCILTVWQSHANTAEHVWTLPLWLWWGLSTNGWERLPGTVRLQCWHRERMWYVMSCLVNRQSSSNALLCSSTYAVDLDSLVCLNTNGTGMWAHTCAQTHTHTHVHTCTNTHTHTHTHARTHTHAHTHTTHTHTHALPLRWHSFL